MGRIQSLIENAAPSPRRTVDAGGQTFSFCCESPGDVVSDAFLIGADELAALARHYSEIFGKKVSTNTVRLAKVIRGTMEGEKEPEEDLIAFYFRFPIEFLAMSEAAQEALGIDPDALPHEVVDAATEVGAGNSQGAAESE